MRMQDEVREATNKDAGSFLLWADAPKWEYSTAPLTYNDGMPVDGPTAGVGGHAIALNDRQVSACSAGPMFVYGARECGKLSRVSCVQGAMLPL